MKSLGIMVGMGTCNANCPHCAGVQHRKDAPKEDKTDGAYEYMILQTLRKAHSEGCKRLSLSGSGEPTLSPKSVSNVLGVACILGREDIFFDPISLYTNGIRIGNDPEFCSEYLTQWHQLGLSWMYVTVHNADPIKNAKGYGVPNYPSLKTILKRIHVSGMKMRANIVLSAESICKLADFKETIGVLMGLGVDAVSAWPIRGMDDEVDRMLAPSDCELDRMDSWTKWKALPVKVQRSRDAYKNGDKMTLFPDGTLSSKWGC